MKKNVNLAAKGTIWFLGWMPRAFLKNIEIIREKINDELLAHSDDDEDEENEGMEFEMASNMGGGNKRVTLA